uniref:Uncharacterized protein n=1 Tax=Chinchilla lanigera TaxID=34839 RepID=A0A8C2VIA6_CHILA
MVVFISTHRSQSTAMIRVTSSAGRPTALSTITMVTRPAWGTPAAPMLAAVASKLFNCAMNTAATAS